MAAAHAGHAMPLHVHHDRRCTCQVVLSPQSMPYITVQGLEKCTLGTGQRATMIRLVQLRLSAGRHLRATIEET
eukprot:364792-Chlamydomonas_euryale.AAC.18